MPTSAHFDSVGPQADDREETSRAAHWHPRARTRRSLLQGSSRAVGPLLMLGPPATEMGGMAGVASLMAEVLRREGVEVAAVATSSSNDPREGRVAKVIRHLRHLVGFIARVREGWQQGLWIHTCSGTSFYHSSMYVLAAKFLRRRVVLHVHGGAFGEFVEAAGPATRRWIRWTLERADLVVVLSEGWRRRIREFAPLGEVAVLENCTALPRTMNEHKADNGACRFGFLGRLDVEKGVLDLLEAARILRGQGVSMRLCLAGPAGTAGDVDSVERRIEQFGLSQVVHVLGPIRGEHKEDFFRSIDVFVLPSHFEGMPLTLIEALARGVPVVATRVGAVPEMITDGAEGLLTPPRDSGAVAAAMRMMAIDSESRGRMGLAARELAERRFSVNRFRTSLMRIVTGAFPSLAWRHLKARPKPVRV